MVTDELRREIERRAGGRCEYCGMHQALQGATFHVEHILPCSRGGKTSRENLGWACPACNLHKSNRVDGIDPESGSLASLFNPRTDAWREHFRWQGYEVVPLTAVARATAVILELNHPRRVQIRRAEAMFSLFPP